MSDAVPAGFYIDPARPFYERWWTGSEWTEEFRPKSASQSFWSVDATDSTIAPPFPPPAMMYPADLPVVETPLPPEPPRVLDDEAVRAGAAAATADVAPAGVNAVQAQIDAAVRSAVERIVPLAVEQAVRQALTARGLDPDPPLPDWAPPATTG